MTGRIVDLYAGPGGWSEGLRMLGLCELGIEWDESACATARAAGHERLQADVSALDPLDFAPCWGLIASPPCQAWSMAGKGGGRRDVEHVIACLMDAAVGTDSRAEHAANCEDARSILVVEPLRWAVALKPQWIALEQVPPVLELWSLYAQLLGAMGYSAWAGVLEAERFGVPQTRERAILMAHRSRPVVPPQPSHQRYVPGEPQRHEVTMFGEVLPWISMAEALGWDDGRSYRLARGEGMNERHGERRSVPKGDPAPVITSKARTAEWVPDAMRANDPAPTITGGHDTANRVWLRAGTNANDVSRPQDEPAPTLRFGARSNDVSWVPTHMAKPEDRPERRAQGAGNRPRPVDAPAATLGTRTDLAEWVSERPAPTITGTRRSKDGMLVGRQLPEGEGENVGGWGYERPSTTVNGDPRISEPGRHDPEESGSQQKNAIRVTVQEAAVLQSFRPDYPWQGSRTAQFTQVGNAVPPLLARAVLGALIGVEAGSVLQETT